MSRFIELEKGIIFGPIKSRRLGRSLGINLLPREVKYCSYDCNYCFYGPTLNPSSTKLEELLPCFDEVVEEIRKVISDLKNDILEIDYITFAGNGEPTLHPRFEEIVDCLIEELQKNDVNNVGTAIFTNGTKLKVNSIRQAINKLDYAFVKVDLLSEERFEEFDRPFGSIKLVDIVRSTAGLNNLVFQTAVMKKGDTIVSNEDFNYYLNLVELGKPKEIHLYNIIYPTVDEEISELSLSELENLKQKIKEKCNYPIKIY